MPAAKELAERVARLAGGLREQGLAPGDWVLLSLENCGEVRRALVRVLDRGAWAAAKPAQLAEQKTFTQHLLRGARYVPSR